MMKTQKNETNKNMIKITCICNHSFNFDVSNIPDGAFYETKCPGCKVVLQRWKIKDA